MKRDFKITGVLKDLPKNSQPEDRTRSCGSTSTAFYADKPEFLTCWGCQSGWVFVKLQAGHRRRGRSRRRCPHGKSATSPTSRTATSTTTPGDDQDWHFVNVKDVHLGKAQDGAMTPGNDRRTIATFAIIALLILGMAVVNFTNLATARASQRAREVALRKVLGATRKQLIVQFVARIRS